MTVLNALCLKLQVDEIKKMNQCLRSNKLPLGQTHEYAFIRKSYWMVKHFLFRAIRFVCLGELQRRQVDDKQLKNIPMSHESHVTSLNCFHPAAESKVCKYPQLLFLFFKQGVFIFQIFRQSQTFRPLICCADLIKKMIDSKRFKKNDLY